jgi:hypothetical protein
MAVYYSTVIDSNLLGDTGIKITETSSLNAFINSLGQEKYIICSLNIWSDNELQLVEPIKLVKSGIEGNVIEDLKIPSVDSYQVINALNKIKVDNWQFDEDCRLDYAIRAYTIVKITLNLSCEEGAREMLSYPKILEELGAENVLKTVKEVLGFKEPDELPQWEPAPAETFKEVEEITPIIKPKAEVKKKEVKEKVAIEDWITPFIVVTSIVLWIMSDDTKYKYLYMKV